MRISRKTKKEIRRAFEAAGLDAELRFPRATRWDGYQVIANVRSRATDGMWIVDDRDEVPGRLPRYSGQVLHMSFRGHRWGYRVLDRTQTVQTDTGEVYAGTSYASRPSPGEAMGAMVRELGSI